MLILCCSRVENGTHLSLLERKKKLTLGIVVGCTSRRWWLKGALGRDFTGQGLEGLAPGLYEDVGIAGLLDGRGRHKNDFGPAQLGSQCELAHERGGALLEAVQDQRQRTGAVSLVE